jgi:metalloprotease
MGINSALLPRPYWRTLTVTLTLPREKKLNRRDLIVGTSGIALLSGAQAIDLGGMLGAAKDAMQAATLTDDQVRSYASQMAKHMDAENRVAPAGNKYATRLAALTAAAKEDNGLRLNYKVYMTSEVNAFAMADGTIRFYSGLMDMMTDDEIRYVIGHEIGHVHAGHTRKRMQTALSTSALQKGVASSGTKAAALADSQLGDLVAQVIRAQHSQGNEREADDYALQFMSRRKYDRKAAVTALEKLDKLSGGSSNANWLSTHPSPRERAERLRTQIV